MEKHSTLFFSDGKKSIDFIIVYKNSILQEDKLSKLEIFIDNLMKTGLDIEIEAFTVDPDTNFIKIHAPDDIIFRYADICDVDLAFRNLDYRPIMQNPPYFMATPLTRPNEEDAVYKRAPLSVSGQTPKNVTTAEKIMVVHKMLTRTKFGPKLFEYGFQKLSRDKVIVDVYPLHDGPYEWTESGDLTDRQLLAKFWANAECFYKEQPIALIEKYYGTEMAFYFAWLGYYIKMLIPLAILGILCVIFGLIFMRHNTRSMEICNSNLIMCPRCHYKNCKFESLKTSCVVSYLTFLFDNPGTIAFAIIVSFWSTVFMELWQRSESILQLEWNVKSLENDTTMRPEYIERANTAKYSSVTQQYEPHVSGRIRVIGYTITLASIALLLLLMILATLAVMIYRITVDIILMRDSEEEIIKKNTRIIASTTGSLISAIFIIIFRMIYNKLALWLTQFENHRTQHHFDHSYIYKCYALAFVNNYSAVFYITLFKGRFFTHPGDLTLWSTFGGLGSDICGPTGCILDLSICLIIIMLTKIVVSNFIQVILPIAIGGFKKMLANVRNTEDLPFYEQQYLMAPREQYFLVDEYLDLVIQYGFVVFFVVAFPLAPVLALINNMIEVRVDASKMTKHFRRPVPKKVTGLGAWFGLLQAITYVGVVTNALVIAFTSDFVPKEVYRHRDHPTAMGYINTTLSAFAVDEFGILTRSARRRTKLCFYPGRRYPPNHRRKYQLTADYWFLLAIRFLVVVVFEHIVIFLKGILAYAIPDVPYQVAQQLAKQEKINKEIRMKMLKEQYMDERRAAGATET